MWIDHRNTQATISSNPITEEPLPLGYFDPTIWEQSRFGDKIEIPLETKFSSFINK